MAALLTAALLSSCSDKDEVENVSELEKSYFSIENATFNAGAIPASTTSDILEGVDMSNQVMNGAMNFITVMTGQNVSKFYVGVKGVDGYWDYEPDKSMSTSSDSYNVYLIPVMISQAYTGDSTMLLSGQLENGQVTKTIEKEVHYIETMPGAIEVKLAFSNSKDIDLHLLTPKGEHIYYGNRGGSYTDDEGNSISYGLDVDSNAGCHIDNINKENIYIPEELVEEGTYTVIVDMYKNCNSSIPTSWSVVTRYKGELIEPETGENPAMGIYKAEAGSGDMTKVMTFSVRPSTRSNKSAGDIIRNSWKFKPAELSETDKMKIALSMED